MKFGCCALLGHYHDVAQAGYEFLELNGVELWDMTEEAFQEALELVCQGPIPCLMVNAFCDARLQFLGPTYDPQVVRDYCQKVTDRAQALGAKGIGIGCPTSRNIPQGFSREKATEQFVESVSILSDCTVAYGMGTMVELQNHTVCNFINDTQQADAICQLVNRDNVDIMMDFFHSERQGEPLSVLETLVHKAVHVHVAQADGFGRKHLDSAQVDKYKAWGDVLRQGGYDKLVSVELTEPFDVEEHKQTLAILRQTMA